MNSTLKSTDNVNSGVPNKEGIIDRWHRCKFRTVTISGCQKQCLQFCLNAFHNDVDNLRKATLLWSCAYWGKEQICRLNDNAFVFNRMLGYNTAIFDEIDKNGNMIVLMILRRHVTSSSTILISPIFSLLQISMTKILIIIFLIILLYKKQMFILLQKY